MGTAGQSATHGCTLCRAGRLACLGTPDDRRAPCPLLRARAADRGLNPFTRVGRSRARAAAARARVTWADQRFFLALVLFLAFLAGLALAQPVTVTQRPGQCLRSPPRRR